MARYWFRQKSFGYGAAPSTWQGWTLTVVSLLLVVGLVYGAPHIRDNSLRALALIVGLPLIVIPTVWISYIKTEGGWRWRSGE